MSRGELRLMRSKNSVTLSGESFIAELYDTSIRSWPSHRTWPADGTWSTDWTGATDGTWSTDWAWSTARSGAAPSSTERSGSTAGSEAQAQADQTRPGSAQGSDEAPPQTLIWCGRNSRADLL